MKINSEILIEGLLLKAVSPLPYEGAQRLLGPVSKKALGILPLKTLNCKKIKIKRKNGGALYLCKGPRRKLHRLSASAISYA